ncbi:hypothetical protein Q3G72_015845 [Acer saccharum]|nr:hypothetical protein Q3G72_015845 [Acer saccharum]
MASNGEGRVYVHKASNEGSRSFVEVVKGNQSGCINIDVVGDEKLWDSVVLSTGKVACKLASFASDHESFSLKKGKDSMQVYHKDKMVSYGSACQASNKKACDVEVRVRNNSSGGLFKLNMGNDVGELSKSDKVKENWHSFLKKKSLDVSKCGAKLSCENKSVLVDSGIVDRMGLFLNSNFLKGDRAILKSEGGSDFGNPSRGVEESLVSRKWVGSKGSSSCAKEIRSRINSLKSDIGPNKFQSNIGRELISCSDNASKVLLLNKDIKKMPLSSGLITVSEQTVTITRGSVAG